MSVLGCQGLSPISPYSSVLAQNGSPVKTSSLTAQEIEQLKTSLRAYSELKTDFLKYDVLDPSVAAELKKSLDDYNRIFQSEALSNPEVEIGKVEKIDFDNDVKIIIKTDLHGDLTSLIKYLNELRNRGYLDENYNVAAAHKDKIVIVFLGDYVDRGPNSFRVLDLLIKLKMLNQDEIVLIRGNHDSFYYKTDKSEIDLYYSANYATNKWEQKPICADLKKFFDSLPLCVFVGSKVNKDEYEYACFTHGAIDINIDVQGILSHPSKRYSDTLVRIDSPAALSARITALLPKPLSDLENEEALQNLRDLIITKNLDDAAKAASLKKFKEYFGTADEIEYKEARKKAKLFLSILKTNQFLKENKQAIEVDLRDQMRSNFNWGDIGCCQTSGFQPTGRGESFLFDPSIIKDYFRAVSSNRRKIKILTAGHQHKVKNFELYGKNFISILPISGDFLSKSTWLTFEDMFRIISITKDHPKAIDWVIQDFSRSPSSLPPLFKSLPTRQYKQRNPSGSGIP